jgi:uncharacterized protein (TIGR02246 family)
MTDIERWVDGYERAWQEADPPGAAGLFTPRATYQESPFDPPMRGRDAIAAYWRQATERQHERRIACRLIASGPEEHIVHFRADFVADGQPLTLDGVLAVRLDRQGLCTALREWWHATSTAPGD